MPEPERHALQPLGVSAAGLAQASESDPSSTAVQVDQMWRRLKDSLTSLTQSAEALGLMSAATAPVATDSRPQAALRRLIGGWGTAGDEADLGFPTSGARLVYATSPSAEDADRVDSTLIPERGWIHVRLGPTSSVALVRHLPRHAGEDRGLKAARAIAAVVSAAVPTARVGVSSSLQEFQGLPLAVDDAMQAASLSQSKGSVAEADILWAEISLLRLRRHLATSVSDSTPVRRLLDYDNRHGSAYAHTLAVWLQNNQDVKVSAERLCIHVNTLRYRVRRVRELVDLDLRDPAQRLVAQLLLW